MPPRGFRVIYFLDSKAKSSDVSLGGLLLDHEESLLRLPDVIATVGLKRPAIYDGIKGGEFRRSRL